MFAVVWIFGAKNGTMAKLLFPVKKLTRIHNFE